MKDIEYERNGIRKMAQERFRKELEAEGWKVVEAEKPAQTRKKKVK